MSSNPNQNPEPDLPNLTLLIKLLQLTTSSHDAESLLAIRKANQELSKFNLTWEELLRSKITIIGADPFIGMTEPPKSTPAASRPNPQSPRPATATYSHSTPPPRPRTPPPPPPPPPSCRVCGAHLGPSTHSSLCSTCYQASLAPQHTTCLHCKTKNLAPAYTCTACGRDPNLAPRPNTYAGYCYCCGTHSPKGAGFIFRKGGKWEVQCSPCYQKNAPTTGKKAKARPTTDSVFDQL